DHGALGRPPDRRHGLDRLPHDHAFARGDHDLVAHPDDARDHDRPGLGRDRQHADAAATAPLDRALAHRPALAEAACAPEQPVALRLDDVRVDDVVLLLELDAAHAAAVAAGRAQQLVLEADRLSLLGYDIVIATALGDAEHA